MKKQTTIDFTAIRAQVKEALDESRYEHTIGVMYTAAALAMRYGEDIEAAQLAGLLHDCAKCVPTPEKLVLCSKAKIAMSDAERQNPGLLHAKLGAYFAEKKYGVKNKSVLSAIKCHTTGKPNMSTLDKILYIADYIEPGRNQAPDLCHVRKLAFLDLDLCLFEILEHSLEYLQEKKYVIDPMTQTAYDYYKKQRMN